LDDREWESEVDEMEAEQYDSAEDTYAAAREYMKVEMMKQGYAYGAEPVNQTFEHFESYAQLPMSPAEFITPAPVRGHRRQISGLSNASLDSATKESNKKRKRGHPEDLDLSRGYPLNGDVIMTDVPPMHSGLTGGLNRLLSRPELPPSPPDMDGIDTSPHSPLKRTKHSTIERERGRTREKDKDKDKKSRKSSDKKESKEKDPKKHKSSHRDSDPSKSSSGRWERRRSSRKDSDSKDTPAEIRPRKELKAIEGPRPMKAIEYRPMNGDTDTPTNGNGALILHPKRAISNAEHFMSFVTKGPESERGCSINKVLKRYHRDRSSRARSEDERDLWKVLRLKRNDRGEIVLII
jgi:cell growth-regulating nucleolar protein